jgi:hypothetical protein
VTDPDAPTGRRAVRQASDRPCDPRGWRARAARLSDRVPTRWLVTGSTLVVLAASAAFGGLDDAPAEALPALGPGDPVTGAQLRIAVERARLLDALPEAGLTPDDGNRLLIVVATVEDVWDGPVPTLPGIGAADNLRPLGIPGIDGDADPDAVLLLADGTMSPELQPHVPMELAFVWEVPAASVRADPGAELAVEVYDKTYRAEGFVTYGERFEDPFPQARASVPFEDIGAGAGG